MKLNITFQLMILAVLFSFTTNAQTFVYNESTSSGMFFESPNGGEVANPLPDDVNSTANCAFSGTENPFPWMEIQYFPNPAFTPAAGDKLFFSVYNPDNSPGAQIQFNAGAFFGGNVTYEAATQTGWVEYSINLDDIAGNELTQVILFPTEGTSIGVYIDNIYFHNESILSPPSTETVWVYNEEVSSGMFFESPNGAEVANPVSDEVNNSANCAFSGTDNPFPWLEIQYFPNPSFTPALGDKLFFSVYNPDNSPGAQIQFNSGAFFGGNVTYEAASQTGWVEYSISLDDIAGNELTQIILFPTEGTSVGVYIDNIYFGSESTLSTDFPELAQEFMFIDTEGRVAFENNQNNAQLMVFDLSGRMLINEKLDGNRSQKTLNQKGIYIVKLQKGNSVSTKKLFYR